MIRTEIQIGEGDKKDTFDEYGFVYLSSDNRISPPTRDFEKTSYPEENGEHIDRRTVYEPFDFKVKFCAKTNGVKRTPPNDNLLTGTRTFTGFDKFGFYNELTGDTYNGCAVAASKGYEWQGVREYFSDIEAGDTFTFSLWFKAQYNSGEIFFFVTQDGNDTNIDRKPVPTEALDGKWHRISHTFTLNSIGSPIAPRVESSVSGNNIYTAGFKLERGDAATAYVPAKGEDGYDEYRRNGTIVKTTHVNTLIKRFNEEISETEKGTDIRKIKQIAFYDHKHRKIVGTPTPISDPEEFFTVSDGEEAAIFELNIRVSSPDLCDFDYSEEE